jgi:membrane protease YdiL (CAAX protease family)
VSLKTGAAVSAVVLISTAYYLVWKSVGRPLRYVRLRHLKPLVAIYAVLSTIALIPVVASLMAVAISFLEIPQAWLEAAYELVRAEDLPELLYVWSVTALLVPVGEEFVFRGVLQNSLSSRFHAAVAVLIASAAFGVLHVWRFPAGFVLGVLLGALYEITGSLITPVVAHVTVNSVVVGGTFLLDRAEPASLPDWIVQNEPAPVLILGLSAGAFVVFACLIWKETRRQRRGAGDGDPGLPGKEKDDIERARGDGF